METAVINDQDILAKMLADSKAALHCQTVALAETTNVQLREIWTNHLNTAIDEHFKLADIAVNKRYNSNPDPVQMIRKDESVKLKL
ncbi:MAG: hypothetical protein APF84_02165 [Gracilibacter sp. BRH_c7a]|nr:MAG: hypothetical protein APF84_02165 [Gracilibacter sp. BRH_c7a]